MAAAYSLCAAFIQHVHSSNYLHIQYVERVLQAVRDENRVEHQT